MMIKSMSLSVRSKGIAGKVSGKSTVIRAGWLREKYWMGLWLPQVMTGNMLSS